jgi:hypothetical protein
VRIRTVRGSRRRLRCNSVYEYTLARYRMSKTSGDQIFDRKRRRVSRDAELM